MREAVANALEAQSDTSRWPFAIIHLTQSLELGLKARLAKVHPVLIFEDVDKRRNTVSITKALERLQTSEIGELILSDTEKSKISKLIELRNKITHADFELTHVYAEAKFFEVFAFVIRFFAQHLDTEIEGVIDQNSLEKLVVIQKAADELASQARSRIEHERRDPTLIWECRNCGENTFVFEDGVDTCYTCRWTSPVFECPECWSFSFKDETEDISSEWEFDNESSHYFVHDNFGYSNAEVCRSCAEKIREDIRRRKFDKYFDWNSLI